MHKNIKILNNGASSVSDLHLLAKELKLKINYIGSIYNLHSFQPGNYILLISPNKHALNGHWQSLYIKKDKAYFFDSFGVDPPQILTDNIKKPIYYNTEQIQNMNQQHCGIFAIDFLYNMNKKGNPETNFNKFTNSFHIYN